MDKSIVEGYERIEEDYGYWPSFHDDVIDKIEISSKGIIFFIRMQTLPRGMVSYPEVKLMFIGIKDFSLEGELYGCASIILSLESQGTDDYIETQLSSSLGTGGTIRSNKIRIDLMESDCR